MSLDASDTIVRPSIHITAPCWINDPCAPGYDPHTGRYHLFYQCNPHGTEWGNMSWGHVFSNDLLTWTRPAIQPALNPDQGYDQSGVFTGCFLPVEKTTTDNRLTVFYSSVRHLPFHWSTPPYPRDAAGLAMATSSDGGKTWNKAARNPILQGEPCGLQVTGFRDPYISSWASMDGILGQTSLYGIVSGGIQGQGPTVFMYTVHPDDPTKWVYRGPLVDLPDRFKPSKKWSGNYGVNWECVNFMTLEAGSLRRNLLVLGAEGDVERNHIKPWQGPSGVLKRTVRSLLWTFGDLVRHKDGAQFQYKRGGYVDHGSLYAANCFLDPKLGLQVMHGWIPEEDVTADYAHQKGWNGALCIPRELFLQCIPNVTGAIQSTLADITSVEIVPQTDGSGDLYTLGIRPISQVARLRENCVKRYESGAAFSLPRSEIQQSEICTVSTSCWEMESTISLGPECESVGFIVESETDPALRVSITFSLVNETITVDRSSSTTNPDVNTCPEEGPFTLFYIQDDDAPSKLEKLQFRFIFDADVVEIYANDRFALTTTVYSGNYQNNRIISVIATGGESSALFEEIKVWDGLNGCKSLIIDE